MHTIVYIIHRKLKGAILMIKFKLQDKMTEKGLSTADLVKKTNNAVHRNTISKLLNGKSAGIQFETLDLICEALGCESVEEIIEYQSFSQSK